MAKRSKSRVGVEVKPVPLPRPLVRGQLTGEVIKAYGGSDREVDIGQRGVVRNLLQKVEIYGLDSSGAARDKFVIEFSEDDSGDVFVDTDGGKRSICEALDRRIAGQIAFHAQSMAARGLTPDIRFVFHDSIRNDEARLAAARAELGTKPVAAPVWRHGYEPQKVTRVTPGKDKGISLSLWQEFKKRDEE